MKKIISLFFVAMFVCSIWAMDMNDIDFSFAPKTHFTEEKENSEAKCGAVSPEISSEQNKTDIALPSKKLRRGFSRFVKTDAFGDAIPDSSLFYRQALSESHKAVYDEIYKAVMNAEEKIQLLKRVKDKEFGNIVMSVYLDNPELWWWAGNISYNYNKNGDVTHIFFSYLFTKEELFEANKRFVSMSLPIIFYAALLDSDIDKIKYVHDYLCQSIEYDYDAKNSGIYNGKLQTAYSAIVEYKTVCAGYSRAFAYYMQQLGIPCVVIYGSGHAWNLLEIEGSFYQMDVTWNDGKSVPPYFNLTHSQMLNVSGHTPYELSASVLRYCPSFSTRFSYSSYFGKTPIGMPYTYQEFENIVADIENPSYARIYIRK